MQVQPHARIDVHPHKHLLHIRLRRPKVERGERRQQPLLADVAAAHRARSAPLVPPEPVLGRRELRKAREDVEGPDVVSALEAGIDSLSNPLQFP
jgi:hypothetical protein